MHVVIQVPFAGFLCIWLHLGDACVGDLKLCFLTVMKKEAQQKIVHSKTSDKCAHFTSSDWTHLFFLHEILECCACCLLSHWSGKISKSKMLESGNDLIIKRIKHVAESYYSEDYSTPNKSSPRSLCSVCWIPEGVLLRSAALERVCLLVFSWTFDDKDLFWASV